MKGKAREAILLAAREAAMAHGYAGINFRDLAEAVGIKAASITYHFPSKALLGEAVARRYCEDIARDLERLASEAATPLEALRRYPSIFRASLARDNRLCLGSFLATERDAVGDGIQDAVRCFADLNVAWLEARLAAASTESPSETGDRARAIYAAVAGAQMVARGRAEIALFDRLIETYRRVGPLFA